MDGKEHASSKCGTKAEAQLEAAKVAAQSLLAHAGAPLGCAALPHRGCAGHGRAFDRVPGSDLIDKWVGVEHSLGSAPPPPTKRLKTAGGTLITAKVAKARCAVRWPIRLWLVCFLQGTPCSARF
jgi:hypothetical protein